MANKYSKNSSTSLATKETQIRMTVRFHLIPATMAIIKKISYNNAGEDAGEKEPSCTVGRNVN
jgi:hypothetical protein